jgi:exodeoxyribonuclease-3
MKLSTWNVNGIRARLQHVLDFLREEQPDVLCLQETKVQDDAFPREPLEDEGYNVEVFGQKSYNGVAILSRQPIEDVVRGLPGDPPDGERRVIGCTIGDLMVLDLYCPNGQEVGAEKYRYKLDWFARLRAFLDERYSTDEKLALVGDFNVTFDDRDVHDPDAWRERILCSTPERQALQALVDFGLEDLLRNFHQQAGIYTWWDYRAGNLSRNDGLRIDHLLATGKLARCCREVIVHKDVREKKTASDHAPVSAVFES